MHGWICPRCEKVHAPSVLSCSCSVKPSVSPTWSAWAWDVYPPQGMKIPYDEIYNPADKQLSFDFT